MPTLERRERDAGQATGDRGGERLEGSRHAIAGCTAGERSADSGRRLNRRRRAGQEQPAQTHVVAWLPRGRRQLRTEARPRHPERREAQRPHNHAGRNGTEPPSGPRVALRAAHPARCEREQADADHALRYCRIALGNALRPCGDRSGPAIRRRGVGADRRIPDGGERARTRRFASLRPSSRAGSSSDDLATSRGTAATCSSTSARSRGGGRALALGCRHARPPRRSRAFVRPPLRMLGRNDDRRRMERPRTGTPARATSRRRCEHPTATSD